MALKIELLEKTDSKVTLHVTGADMAFVNALRRAVISGVPCFAIDEVDFYENNSPLYNDFIANRLGLVPLTFQPKVKPDARISLTLNVEGPQVVYSKELVSADEEIRPVSDAFPIVELGEGQRLRFEAFAVRGVGRKHAKFQCAHSSYGLFPKFKLKKESPKFKDFAAALPKSMLDSDGKPVAWKCEVLEDFARDNPEIADYSLAEDEFVFFVESYNNVAPLDHLRTALEVMADAAKELRKELK